MNPEHPILSSINGLRAVATATGKPRVLIVEDEGIVALDLRQRLIRLGYEVPETVASGERAIQAATRHAPDVVLMDIHLQGKMDGIEAAKHIVESLHLPVIYLTAYSEENTLARARATRPYGYLLKPFSERELHASIQVAIERHRVDQAIATSEVRLRMAMDAARLHIWEMTPGGQDMRWLEGEAPTVAGGETLAQLQALLANVHADDQAPLNALLEQLDRDPMAQAELEFRLTDEAGDIRWMSLYAKHFNDPHIPATIVGVMQDVTQRRATEDRLRQAAAVFNWANEGIAILNDDGTIEAANDALARMLNRTPATLQNMPLAMLLSDSHGDGLVPLWGKVRGQGHWRGEVTALRGSGEPFPAGASFVHVGGTATVSGQYVAVFTDLSSLRRVETELARLAHFDTLTGLPNRALTLDRLHQGLERAKRDEMPLALLCIDLDHFKHVNETMGHQAGDLLLNIVGQRMQKVLHPGDTIGRFGGDEFAVILDSDHEGAHAAMVAQALIDAVAQPITLSGKVLTVSASIGISLFPLDAADDTNLIGAADAAMYAAKDKGRNRYAFYTAEMTARADLYLNRTHELRRALANNEFRLFYQPQLRLRDGKLIGLEALIRWQHPERGLLPAAEIIPIAEESHLIIDIGAWVIEETCRQISQWRDQGLAPVRVAVNVSTKHILEGTLVGAIAEMSQKYGVDTNLLEIEVTESALQSDKECVATLHALRALGAYLSIDDFGTGYSCLSSLKLLPLQRVKIDQSFTRGLMTDANDQAIVSAIIAIGHQMHLNVMAEGLETAEQAEKLLELGCDCGQGYHFGRPMPAHAIADFIRNHQPKSNEPG